MTTLDRSIANNITVTKNKKYLLGFVSWTSSGWTEAAFKANNTVTDGCNILEESNYVRGTVSATLFGMVFYTIETTSTTVKIPAGGGAVTGAVLLCPLE